ncbi:hypothetical protein BS78_04G214200 [Paspalum vaginatum]|nr:hypothetical protein BS78_04G214200 [Paspalum vaginatum]
MGNELVPSAVGAALHEERSRQIQGPSGRRWPPWPGLVAGEGGDDAGQARPCPGLGPHSMPSASVVESRRRGRRRPARADPRAENTGREEDEASSGGPGASGEEDAARGGRSRGGRCRATTFARRRWGQDPATMAPTRPEEASIQAQEPPAEPRAVRRRSGAAGRGGRGCGGWVGGGAGLRRGDARCLQAGCVVGRGGQIWPQEVATPRGGVPEAR